jgi:phenylacetic acid degradation operon negative regulatory protein
MAQAHVMSTIERVPLSYFVYSALSYFGRARGGELPGIWFVEALGEAGREAAAVRQTLYRMEREGELVTRRSGRMKYYRASSYADAEIDAGTAKIFERTPRAWDGEWTVVHVGLRTPALAAHRDRVKALLAVEGFAQIDTNVYVHPHGHVAERLAGSLPARAKSEVVILRGALLGREAQQTLLALWPIDALAKRYRKVLAAFADLEKTVAAGVSDRDAFLLRFGVVFEHLGVAWDEPDLPDALLPSDWPGTESRIVAARLYEQLLPGATRFADAVLARVTPESKRTKVR